jgi:hypothetical protein
MSKMDPVNSNKNVTTVFFVFSLFRHQNRDNIILFFKTRSELLFLKKNFTLLRPEPRPEYEIMAFSYEMCNMFSNFGAICSRFDVDI